MSAWLLAIVFVGGTLWSAPQPPAQTPVPEQSSLAELHDAALAVMQAREDALRDLSARYQAAAMADRVGLETEGAALEESYERQYLEILVEYHRLSGNAAELERTERMLEALDNPVAAGRPLDQPRDLTIDAPATPVQEGAVQDER
jgi:hypothetical protein